MQLEADVAKPQISFAYLPPTPAQSLSVAVWAAALLIGLVALAPFAAQPMPHVNGFIPALDATIATTDLITVSLLIVHFLTTQSKALLALACGYLFSALIVVAHALSFRGVVTDSGNLGGSIQTTIRLYLFWHLGIPGGVFAHIWLRSRERTQEEAPMPSAPVAACSVLGVLALVCCTVWFARLDNNLLPWATTGVHEYDPLTLWLILPTMLVNVVALAVLWFCRRSALDLWLSVTLLASIVELAITALVGGPTFSLGFYTGRIFSVITSTVILTILLAETSRLYARLAFVNMLTSVAGASQALSSEIILPNLIERLMTIALHNTGADRSLLVLAQQQDGRIAAEARMDNQGVSLRQDHSVDTAAPASIIRHVMQTQESIVLKDAAKLNRFSGDPYFARRQVRSVLCLPLVGQGALGGLLYLENAKTAHVFTPDRVKLLELLASQAAISLENTRLYASLQEREARVRRLIEANIVGIFTWNLDGQIIEGNDAFLEIVGYDHDDLASGRMCWKDLMPKEWDPANDHIMNEMVARGAARPFQAKYIRKDGNPVPVMIGAALFDGAPTEGVAFVVNMTDQKRAEELVHKSEEQYREIQLELAHSNRVATIGTLSSSIAHELNQPLQGATTNGQTALRLLEREDPKIEDARRAISRLIRDVTRASSVVSGMRALIKKAPPQKGPLDINEVVRDIVGFAHGEVTKSGISVRTQLSQGSCTIQGDRVQLQQVVLNLVMNAVDAIRGDEGNPREILICTENLDANNLQVSVQDSGPGIDSANIERIFDAFYTTKAHGLGMGLSICRSIVDAHGGKLWAARAEHRGSIFCFTLPISHEQEISL